MSELVTKDLGNGIHLHVIPTRKFKTTSVKVLMQRPLDDKATMTALLPLVLKRGSQSMPDAVSMEKQLEEYMGAQFDADVFKIGERHGIGFSLSVVNGKYLNRDINMLEKGFSFLHEVINKPLVENGRFHEPYVEQEKNVLSQRIQTLFNDKGYWALKRCIEATCADEPYAISQYGSLQDIEHVSASDLFRFYNSTISTSPIDIFVVGDVEVDTVEQILINNLKFDRDTLMQPTPTVSKHKVEEKKRVFDEEEVNQGKLVLSLRTNTSNCDRDYAALLFYDNILGGGTHSKLFMNVREKNSLAYYAQTQMESTKGLLFILSGIEFVNYQRAVEIIEQQLEDMKQGVISEEEFTRSRVVLLNSLKSVHDSARSSISYYLPGLLAGCPRSVEQLRNEIMAVSKEDIINVAQKVSVDTVYFLHNGSWRDTNASK